MTLNISVKILASQRRSLHNSKSAKLAQLPQSAIETSDKLPKRLINQRIGILPNIMLEVLLKSFMV